MKYSHDQHIGVYENSISDEWCDKVINFFEQNIQNSLPREGVFGSNSVRDKALNLDQKSLLEPFLKSFNNCYSLYEYKYPSIQHEGPFIVDYFKIQKTLPTEGYHPYHIEHNDTFPSLHRIGAYTVYLNDVEEGGETEFLYQLKRIKPKKGTLVIFPAGYTHPHRGNTPFSGEKYIMTGWLSFPENTTNGS
tara:strand:- start:76 stop:648 length:573 start_codon:yes stop_codon:yes gene_type:complete